MTTLLLVATIVLCFSLGDVCLTRGMKRVGKVSFRTAAVLLRACSRVLRSPFVLVGVGLQLLAFATFVVALHDLSYFFPLTSTSDIVTTLGARHLLRETVTPTRWAGVVIVSVGIALISAS